jgi:hypothetical protein
MAIMWRPGDLISHTKTTSFQSVADRMVSEEADDVKFSGTLEEEVQFSCVDICRKYKSVV